MAGIARAAAATVSAEVCLSCDCLQALDALHGSRFQLKAAACSTQTSASWQHDAHNVLHGSLWYEMKR
jgi:hypothetical protein